MAQTTRDASFGPVSTLLTLLWACFHLNGSVTLGFCRENLLYKHFSMLVKKT